LETSEEATGVCGRADSGIWEGDFLEEGTVLVVNDIPHKIFLLPFCFSLPESGRAVHHLEVLTWSLSGHSEEREEVQDREI
jgi:hypothetical protein